MGEFGTSLTSVACRCSRRSVIGGMKESPLRRLLRLGQQTARGIPRHPNLRHGQSRLAVIGKSQPRARLVARHLVASSIQSALGPHGQTAIFATRLVARSKFIIDAIIET